MRQEIKVLADLDAISRAAAAIVCETAQDCVRRQGYFTLAFSGGQTPETVYRLLSRPPYQAAMPWQDIYCFWSDERMAPPDAAASNFRMVHEALLAHVAVPDSHICRVRTEMASPKEAAANYEQDIRQLFAALGSASQTGFPVFDLILLGVGVDGHTASLFPGDAGLSETVRWTAVGYAPSGQPRITLTLPVINAASHVLFLAAGKEKREVLSRIFYEPAYLPAGMVKPDALWLVDEAAWPAKV